MALDAGAVGLDIAITPEQPREQRNDEERAFSRKLGADADRKFSEAGLLKHAWECDSSKQLLLAKGMAPEVLSAAMGKGKNQADVGKNAGTEE